MHPEHQRWSRIFSGSTFYYGHEPGPVARRAVRYHRPMLPSGGTALDAGAGEGQDLAFLAEAGYVATGLEWTATGVEKTRRLLAGRNLSATVIEADFREWESAERFNLVLAVNSLQFLGEDAPSALQKLMRLTNFGGVVGLSVFGRKADESPLQGTVYRWTLDEILRTFSGWQSLEAAQLWQWSNGNPQEFVTLIAAKR